MSSFRSSRDKNRLNLFDKRERMRSCNDATPSFKADILPGIISCFSPHIGTSGTEAESKTGSFEDLFLKPLTYLLEDYQSTGADKESTLPRKRLFGRRSQSTTSLCQLGGSTPGWIMELKIYTVYDINTGIVRDGTNTCIKIKQDLWTLGKTSTKTSSSQQVWEETFNIPLSDISQPIVLKYCSRKAGRFTTLGEAELSLDECMIGFTYSKHLEILSPGCSKPIGTLRMQVCLHDNNSSPCGAKSCSFESGHRSRKPSFLQRKLHSKQKSSSTSNLLNTTTAIVGPLKSGVQIFEARYLGLLQLNVVTRPFSVYARRWSPLEYQPGEVVVITNPLTKATELVSPRLPWPPHFLRGVTALDFDPISGPQVSQFDSAVLYINVLSACGLQSIPLAKFLSKCRRDGSSYDSIQSGVMAARLISYYQTMAKHVQPLSTQVQLQMGKDKYLTTVGYAYSAYIISSFSGGIEKSTFDPVWNQVFTFNINCNSNSLIEVQLMCIHNPSIAGPAAGTEKIGEALIDISRLPMDFTQRIEIELNGKRPKPRLLVLATLTGLTKSNIPCPCLALPPPSVTSPGACCDQQCDTESNCVQSTQQKTSQENEGACPMHLNEGCGASMNKTKNPSQLSAEEIDAQIVEHYVSFLLEAYIWPLLVAYQACARRFIPGKISLLHPPRRNAINTQRLILSDKCFNKYLFINNKWQAF
ncbi:unnamed protein product [Rodentolepis nana]|uniref:C2 domain-containing protein n=1 Tax=Rodentolepis nana TaxID=102285 RepID=A0A0R3TAX0_RODNA|nr:unnamed protein product [Rodentolepis nana]